MERKEKRRKEKKRKEKKEKERRKESMGMKLNFKFESWGKFYKGFPCIFFFQGNPL